MNILSEGSINISIVTNA